MQASLRLDGQLGPAAVLVQRAGRLCHQLGCLNRGYPPGLCWDGCSQAPESIELSLPINYPTSKGNQQARAHCSCYWSSSGKSGLL